MGYVEQFYNIKDEWESFKRNPNNTKVRIRDAAKKLDVSEAELLSTLIEYSVDYINFDSYQNFIKKILSLDKIMLLTRSDNVVHEIIINTNDIEINQHDLIYNKNTQNPLLQIKSDDIAYTFSELKEHQGKNLFSFQFFNGYGDSIAKIYLKGKTESLFRKIILEHKIDYDYSIQKKQPHINKKIDCSNSLSIEYKSIPKNATKFKASKKFDGTTLRTVMEGLAKKSISVQFHAIAPNAVQYYYGKIKNVIDYGPWINVIDKTFNIHILENKIVSSQLDSFKMNNKNYHSLVWFDSNKNNIMGISPLEDSVTEFKKLLKGASLL